MPTPSNRVIRRLGAAIAITAAMVAAAPPAGAAVPGTAPTTAPSTTRLAGLRPGMSIRRDGISMRVPPAGQTMWATTTSTSGRVDRIGLETTRTGMVILHQGDGLAAPTRGAPATFGALSSSSLSKCSDGAYLLYSSKLASTFKWYYKTASTPSYLSSSATLTALRNAITTITHGTNACGLPDLVSATSAYQGSTTSSSNITSTGACGSNDGKSVVDFGTLPSTMLAYSCWWTNGTTTIAADMRINSAHFSWVIATPAGCLSKFVVRAVATHEWGHIFGLGHVTEPLHGAQTMAPIIMPCQAAENTLGLGDVKGLDAKY